MGRLLFFMALGFLVIWQIRRFLRKRDPENTPTRVQHPKGADGERMVACARCGVNIPESESFTSRGMNFCSAQHVKLGASGDDSST